MSRVWSDGHPGPVWAIKVVVVHDRDAVYGRTFGARLAELGWRPQGVAPISCCQTQAAVGLEVTLKWINSLRAY